MKLYYHPVSTTCRPIMMFAGDHQIPLDYVLVDLFTGEHVGESYSALNPNQLVPLLDHDGFRLTESSAILKYLADHAGSAAYPKDLQQRARVNETMDWFHVGLGRDYAYGFVYPQVLPNYKRADPAFQAAHLDWSRPRAVRLLNILDQQMIGPKSQFVLGGEQPTLADYLGFGILTLGETAKVSYARWPNIERWIANMKARPSFAGTHEVFYSAFVGAGTNSTFAAL